MKLRSIQKAALEIICGTILLLHGCSSNTTPNVITVTVNPSTAIVIAGQVQTFTATVGGSTNITVTNWPCTYSYTPPPTTTVPNPVAKTGPCTSGGTLPGGTGTFGTWVISTTNGSNVLTYTAPTLANFPNPVPVLTFTATSDADTKKTGTATVGIDSGIRVSVSPSTVTVPVGLNPAQKVTFNPSFLNTSPVGQQWHLVQPNTSSTTTADQTPNPTAATCDPTCGTIDNNGIYTAPATLPTDTKPAGSKSTSPTTVYAVVWSEADPNHYTYAQITLVNATTNPITFSGISPSTVAAGGVSQDIYLNAKNFLNTTRIFFTAPGQTTGSPIDSTNIFTIPISAQYCTPSASGVTPVVTCDASILTRIRLTSTQLGVAGTAKITVTNIPGTTTATPPCAVVPNSDGSTDTTSIACPLDLIYASPAVVAAVPDSFPQGQNAQIGVNGGYYGATNQPIVSLLLSGTLGTVFQSGPRQFVAAPQGSQLSSPGLYEVSVQSQAPLASAPQFPLVTTNFAVQPNFQSVGTVTSVPLNTTAASGTNLAPSSFAINSPKGYAVMTEQGGNSLQLVDLTGSVPVQSGLPVPVPGGTTAAPVASEPTGIAIDDQLNIPGFSGQDLGVVVSSGDSTLRLFALSRTSATYLGISIPVDLDTLLQQPGATGLAKPFAIGVDPGTHLGVVAYGTTNIGFIVDVNPNLDNTDTRTCFISTQKPPCVIAPVSMNTGAYPQVVLQPQAPFAYVTPGGSGSTSLVDLLQKGKSATIAPAVSGGTSGAVRTAGITKIICNQATPHGINPALGGTVIISGLTPTSFNGTYQVIGGSVTNPWTFSYAQQGLPDEVETNDGTKVPDGTVQYGTPYYTFNTTRFASAAAINPTTRTFAAADYNASTNQIQFIGTLDQTLTSLTLTAGSCNGCTPNPSGAPETGFHSVAFDPFTNVLIAYDPADQAGPEFPTNAISLINPGGPSFNGTFSPYRIVKAISVGEPGQGSYTAAGQTAATVVNGPMTYDPKSRYVLVANAGSNKLSYVNLDPDRVFKKVAIQQLKIVSAGVANAQPDLNQPFPVAPAECDPTNTDGSKPCMAQAVPLGQTAKVRVLGQGFGVSAGAIVRLDSKVSTPCSGAGDTSFCTTFVSDSEVDVTIPASMLTVAHDYALDVQAGGVVSNSIDLHAVGVIDLKATCAPTQNFPQGPEGVAIDSVKHIAYITNFACNSVSSITLDPAGFRKADNTLLPYGSILNTVTVGKNPVGIDVIPRLNFAVVANNGDSPTGTASILDITDPAAMKVLSFTTTSGSTSTTATSVPVGLSPLGVAIFQDRALALIANSGSNTLTSIDLTVLLPTATTTKTPAPTTVAVTGAPTAIAIDPNRAIAVVTVLKNSGSTVATAGLDVINLSSTPPIRSNSASVSSLTASLTGIVYDQAVSPALFYATSTQQNAIYTFNPDSGATLTIRVGINPYSLAYNYQTGTILTVNSTSDTSSVIDSQTFKTRETLGISSLSQFAVAMDNLSNTVVMVDQNNNRVILLAMPK
jgi:DNA-binding beta-propeller fold protein YncE